MVKYQEVLHGSTSELYINGEREELVTKIEIKMTGDFEDSSFCGEYGTFPIYNGYAIEGTISGKKRNSTLENAIVEGYRTGEMRISPSSPPWGGRGAQHGNAGR